MTNTLARNLPELAPDAGVADPVFERHPAPSLLFTREGLIAQANAAARQLLCNAEVPLADASLADVFPSHAKSLAGMAPPLSLPRAEVRRADGSNFIARVRVVAAGPGPATLLLASIEDLSEFQAEIDAANREFEALTSAAGHDLRGPLRILKGFTEALEDECGDVLNEEGRNFLKEILKAGDRMEGLIDGLLAYSRASRGELSCENLDLSTLVELVYYELRHTQPNRAVDCQVDAGLNAWGDVRLMMTVLRNLLSNAWKFTARNASASIRCHIEERDGRRWVCVTDNGAGFEMTQATRLFKPFTRLHRQDEFPGHGMGLATAHRIVKRHGGEIEAESRPGEGTTVRFYLPAAD
jgi:signal transduction histidine kinase